jgi:hypothetical protein
MWRAVIELLLLLLPAPLISRTFYVPCGNVTGSACACASPVCDRRPSENAAALSIHAALR